MERFGEPTWRAVVKVVAHPAAGDNCALALSIAKQHPGNILNNRLLQNVYVFEYVEVYYTMVVL